MRRPAPGPAPVVAIIGPVGAGKSVVLGFFKELGAAVMNFDDYSRELLQPGTSATQAVREVFGERYVGSQGRVDREALAKLIFSDEPSRLRLESLLHPPMLARLRAGVEEFRRQPSAPLLVVEGAILGRLAPDVFDAFITTAAPDSIRAERLRAKGLNPETIEDVVSLQRRLGLEAAEGDFVVDGSQPLSHVRMQVARLWLQLTGRPAVGNS